MCEDTCDRTTLRANPSVTREAPNDPMQIMTIPPDMLLYTSKLRQSYTVRGKLIHSGNVLGWRHAEQGEDGRRQTGKGPEYADIQVLRVGHIGPAPGPQQSYKEKPNAPERSRRICGL